ncbi:caspase-8-like isoform X1 [Polypterus senegalus]|uniref:caspase-8-like isoform X1 n=2 Tax=Polypterus senegalus TaxID=55291 RepID=UPI0019659B99|nr:caspase-8-like isoform X1 [Polypterus senegalus]XP_039613723.1 caspase-8-like isoform X1 [Polypterus senegalus]XP_039613725.1 caspase-8-like isoform X1 [Polypterus senegalus]
MEFQVCLYKVEQLLGREHLEPFIFLCRDVAGRDLGHVSSFTELFSEWKRMDLLSADDMFLVAEMLYRTRCFWLLRKLGLDKNKVKECLPEKGRVSAYRQMLFDVSEDLGKGELRDMKFLLQETLPVARLEESLTVLKLFEMMEKEDVLDQENLCILQDVLKRINKTLWKKVETFRQEMVCCSQETQDPSLESWVHNQSRSELSQPEHPPQQEVSLDQQSLQSLEFIDVQMVKLDLHAGAGVLEPMPPGDVDGRSLRPASLDGPVCCSRESFVTRTQQPLEVYDMNRPSRGFCLIFNNGDFAESRSVSSEGTDKEPLSDRTGTDVDADHLEAVFQWLGFNTVRRDNFSQAQIQQTLEEYKDKDHRDRDCFVCCILTHGTTGRVFGTDGKALSINKLTTPFSGFNCPHLRGKPKLFFIQACQGSRKQHGVSLEVDGCTLEDEDDASIPKDIIPEDSDFLIGMSTMDGFVSFRHRTNGTWYIQALCKSLQALVPRGAHMLDILTKVNNDVSQQTDKTGRRWQIPQPVFSLRKLVIFPNPERPPPVLGSCVISEDD